MEVLPPRGFANLTGVADSYEETLLGFIIGYFAVIMLLTDLMVQGLIALFFIWEPSMGISRNLKQAIIAGVKSICILWLTAS
jgi:hypothetical protein